jgi:hypothetical protein
MPIAGYTTSFSIAICIPQRNTAIEPNELHPLSIPCHQALGE